MIGLNGRLDIEDEMVKDRAIDIIKTKEHTHKMNKLSNLRNNIKWCNDYVIRVQEGKEETEKLFEDIMAKIFYT